MCSKGSSLQINNSPQKNLNEMKRFGKKLHNLRKSKNWSLKDLALELGYSTHSYISEIESGQKIPTALFILKISRLFEVTTDELLKDEMEVGILKKKISDRIENEH